MDLHTLHGETPELVALAYLKDLEVQWKHGVRYLRGAGSVYEVTWQQG